MNQKKGQPDHIGPPVVDSPHFSKIDGRCETRLLSADSDSPRAVSGHFLKARQSDDGHLKN